MADQSVDDLHWRANLAKSILNDVIDSSKHEDEKVGRILASMSFLIVGATIVYSTFIGNRLGAYLYGVQLVSALFFAYLLLLIVSTVIMLESMSPRIYLHLARTPESLESGASLSSLESMHFFKSIAKTDEAAWLATFKDSTTEELLVHQREDALRQARYLSKKVTQKVEFVRLAKWIILLDSGILVAMVAVGVISYLF